MGAQRQLLLMLQGLPGSGKSTHAKQLVEQGNWVRVNKDDLRGMMDNSVYSKKNEDRVKRAQNAIIFDAMANGFNVVVDNTNFHPDAAPSLSSIAEQFGARFKIRFFDTPLEDCLLRNEQREKPVPVDVIMSMYNKYLAPKEEADVDNDAEDELEECIIVDIDGTLAHIDPDNPRNIYDDSKVVHDLLDDAVSNIVGMAYRHGYRIIVMSGRQQKCEPQTREWLELHGIEFDSLYMRTTGDRRKDDIVKQELYEKFVKGKFHVKYILDDRPSVCRMWRSLGLKVLQVGDPHIEF